MCKIIVATSGTFDILHPGHITLLKASRALGDSLVVGVKTDEAVALQKGYRPIMDLGERVTMLKSCRYVDEVYVQQGDAEEGFDDLIKNIRPAFFTCGNDNAAAPFVRPYLAKRAFIYVIFNFGIQSHATDIKQRIIRYGNRAEPNS